MIIMVQPVQRVWIAVGIPLGMEVVQDGHDLGQMPSAAPLPWHVTINKPGFDGHTEASPFHLHDRSWYRQPSFM
jgi:hypothetical protein